MKGTPPGLYLQSLGGASSAGLRGEGFLPGPKSPSSGSTSSSKMERQGEGLGFTATSSGRFLELGNHRQNSRFAPLTGAQPASHTGTGQA